MEDSILLSIIGFSQVPTWGLVGWMLRENRTVKDCVIKIKTALKIAHPELEKALSD